MPIPDYQTLMLPVLISAAQGVRRVPEVADAIAEHLKLSAQEREELLPSGRQRILHNRIHWAKFYLYKAGLVEAPTRGQFTATEAGKQVLATNPQKIDVQTLLKFPNFKAFYAGEANGPAGSTAAEGASAADTSKSSEESTPEELIESAHLTLTAALREELLERISQNSPAFFERLIVDLLVAMGYGGSQKSAAEQLGKSGDGGVDGVINEDPLGLDRVYVQAKRYTFGTNVGRPDIQGFVGSLVGLGATKGVFVTTSSFSQNARDFVKHLSQRVILIDGARFAELMIEHGVGVRTMRSLELKRLDEDFFTEPE